MIYLSSTAKKFLTLLAVLLLFALLLSPDIKKKPIKLLSLPVGTSVYYLQIASNGLFQGISQYWESYFNLVNVQQENQQLRQTISALKAENSQLREKGVLADRLKRLLGYKEQAGFDTIAAAIIGRKPSQWFDTIMIDKGSLDGIQADMGVLAPEGVVGKVIDVGRHYAQVLLASDRNSAIGAMVQRTRDVGIAQGLNADSFRLKYLPHDAEVAVGDLLVTSGMEGSFTKGLNIGQIEQIERKKGELFLRIKTTISVDLNKVEEVLVIRKIDTQAQ